MISPLVSSYNVRALGVIISLGSQVVSYRSFVELPNFSRRLHVGNSTLGKSFTESELKKYRESINEPCPGYQMSAETKKIADCVLLPGDKCRAFKKRRADILRLLFTVLNFTYCALISNAKCEKCDTSNYLEGCYRG